MAITFTPAPPVNGAPPPPVTNASIANTGSTTWGGLTKFEVSYPGLAGADPTVKTMTVVDMAKDPALMAAIKADPAALEAFKAQIGAEWGKMDIEDLTDPQVAEIAGDPALKANYENVLGMKKETLKLENLQMQLDQGKMNMWMQGINGVVGLVNAGFAAWEKAVGIDMAQRQMKVAENESACKIRVQDCEIEIKQDLAGAQVSLASEKMESDEELARIQASKEVQIAKVENKAKVEMSAKREIQNAFQTQYYYG